MFNLKKVVRIMENTIINQFVIEFNKDMDTYEKVKRDIHRELEMKLNDTGIMALVTSRVKDPGRLKEKLLNRNTENIYKSKEDIYSDIVDLIGLRIALYFPNDIARVEELIKSEFEVGKIKVFPEKRRNNDTYANRFEGYSARHYRITYSFEEKQYKAEIQVASLLMHAWAEVEHDLAYKQKKGVVSFDEYEALDEINGLVIAGEISLQRLQRISELRMSAENEVFTNHYQLADYIYKNLEKKNLSKIKLGDIEALYKFLSFEKRLTKKKVDNDLRRVNYMLDTSIAEQIMDIYANKNSRSSIELMKIKAYKDPLREEPINEMLVGRFLTEWIKLEKLLMELSHQFMYDGQYRYNDIIVFLKNDSGLSKNIVEKYIYLRKARNMIVHGVEIPEDYVLVELINDIDSMLKQIKSALME